MSLFVSGTAAVALSFFTAAGPPGAKPLDEVMRGLDQTGTPAPPAKAPPAESRTLGEDKRPVPEYRGPAADEAGVVPALLWVPRAVLFPAYAVAEYGVRRPMVGLVTVTEKHYVVPRLQRIFTWDEGRAGIYPTFGINLGLRPSAGVLFFDDRFGDPDTDIKMSGSISRRDVFGVSGRLRRRVLGDRSGMLFLTASYASRDDQVFYGLGPDTRESERVYYSRDRLDLGLGFDDRMTGWAHLITTARLRDARFGDSQYRADQGIQSRYGGPNQPALPEGFSEGYTVAGVSTKLVLDSRRPTALRPAGTGIRFQVDGGMTASLSGAYTRFADYGGELAGFVDASGYGHALSLRTAVHFQEPLSGTTIPFDEQFGLSQFEGMRGFIDGRVRGQSAILVEAQYRYPIATLVDAELFSGLGNAFDGHLDGFAPQRVYWDYGLTLRTISSRDSWWGVTLAFGSSRLDSSNFTAADFVRLSAGFNQGF